MRHRRIRLTGPSPPIDPRRVAVRRDLADIALADVVFAQHYAEPLTMRAIAATIVREAPADDAARVTSLDVGDDFAVLEIGEKWCWGRCCNASANGWGCVGYVATAALAAP